MTESFTERLARHISVNGPLPLAEFMHWAMSDPAQGYYSTCQPIGRAGDFITAPEVSQMFGELLGIWAIAAWQAIGSPARFNLVEIGPGRGTLMADMLRAAASHPSFMSSANIILVETSDSLTQTQKETLVGHDTVEWIASLHDLPDWPSIILANELLDVLPVRQYVKTGAAWHERSVGLDTNGKLSWVLGTGRLPDDSLPAGHENEPDGAVFEISPVREAFIRNTATALENNGGVALFMDYGHGKTAIGDTFQAVKNHRPVDPLEMPGAADLTSHVDFEALQNIALSSGMHVFPLMTQGEFLLSLGLLQRAGALGRNQSPEIQQRITGEAERLALPGEMGEIFKAFAFSGSAIELTPFPANDC